MAKKEETDYAAMEKLVMDAKDNLDSLVGMELTNQDNIRMVPDNRPWRNFLSGITIQSGKRLRNTGGAKEQNPRTSETGQEN